MSTWEVKTLWIMIQGYRLITGQSREPAMVFVTHLGKIALITSLASSVSVVNEDIRRFVTTDMSNAVNYMVNGSHASMVGSIDRNLAYTQTAYAAIDSVQVPLNDAATAEEKARSLLIATLGTSSPSMTAGAIVVIALKAPINTAEALRAAKIINNITRSNAEGFNSQALQQGGVGLLMTALILSASYMAGQLFKGTLGNFMYFSGSGGGAMSRPGP